MLGFHELKRGNLNAWKAIALLHTAFKTERKFVKYDGFNIFKMLFFKDYES